MKSTRAPLLLKTKVAVHNFITRQEDEIYRHILDDFLDQLEPGNPTDKQDEFDILLEYVPGLIDIEGKIVYYQAETGTVVLGIADDPLLIQTPIEDIAEEMKSNGYTIVNNSSSKSISIDE